MPSEESKQYNKSVSHPLQSYEWGEFRKKTGIQVIREDDFQLTIHPIPHIPFTIGYLPKGNMPAKKSVERLAQIGKENKCIFIQLEPNIQKSETSDLASQILDLGLIPATHPLFTRYTFVLDLTKSEEDLLKAMHPKARYNIRVAEKHGVTVTEETSEKAFNEFWRLTEETTHRQKFYAHTKKYHSLQWETFPHVSSPNGLTSHLLIATYQGKILTTWVLFVFKDTLYYPYGASSQEHKDVMANNLVMWEAIKFGKKLGLKKFDLWGSLGPNADKTDPWFGFHTFKERYGPELIEFVGSFDLVINKPLYQLYKIADRLRWLMLRVKK